MLKLYNKEHVAVAALTNLKDYKIEYVLSGEDLLEFSLSICDKSISLVEEEGYVRTKFNEYVIKAMDPSQSYKRFTAIVNIESIKGKSIKNFDTSNNSITDTIRLAIAGTGWILADTNITKRRTVRLKNTNALEVLKEVRKVFRVDFRFDAINKIIYVYEKFGSDKGVYFSDELNLIDLQVPSETHNYATRLYPYGKDGLNIATINNGKKYIENFQYSNKVIELIWEDNRYTIIEHLKEDAIAKLEELSKPKRSYQADIVDLAKHSDEYKFLDFFLGDTITLLSKTEKFRDKQRIVKYIEYPDDPSKNTCELGNTALSFEELQQENEYKNQVVDNITSDNGTVDGSKIDSIKTNQISDFEANVAKITDLTVINAKIYNLEAHTVTITGQLSAVEARIGTLEANVATIDKLTVTHSAYIADLQASKASITHLEAVNAAIKVLESNAAKIETLVNGNLSSENIQSGGITSDRLTIENGFIKNVMIDSLDVSKINAGDISTNKFKIKSDDGGIEIVGATQQFKDKNNKVRIQMGKDAKGEFNFIIRGEDGTTTLIDHTGVKSKAIADDLIKENMIAEDAVGEKQINYSKFIEGFNKDTNTKTLKATKIKLDNQEQTLEFGFNQLKTQSDDTKTTTESNATQITVHQGRIETLIANTTIVKDGKTTTLKDDYNNTVATVDSIKSTIGSHTTQINDATGKITGVETRVNTVERDLNGISERFSSTTADIKTVSNLANDANRKIDSFQSEVITINSKVVEVQKSLSGINSRVESVETTNTLLGEASFQNLLYNTDLSILKSDNQPDGWINSGIAGLNTTKLLDGIPSFHYRTAGLTSDAWKPIQSSFILCLAGQSLVGSWYVWIPSGVTIDRGLNIEIEFFRNDDVKISQVIADADLNIREKWQRIVAKGKAPANCAKARLRIHCTRNGEFYASKPMIQLGDTLTGWQKGMDIRQTEVRLKYAEQKITDDSIVSTVSSQFYKKGETDSRYASQTQITQLSNQISSKVDVGGVKSIIQQNPNDVQIGFNGINERITINPRSMDFTATNGNRDMSLYGGQLCAFNSGTNKFLSTTGSIIADNYNIRGAGFLLSKHCNHFLIGRDNDWDDIFTNRAPKPVHYLDIDFDNYQIKMALPLLTSDVNMRGNNLGDVNVAYIKDVYTHGLKDHNTGQQLISSDSQRMIVHLPISFNGNILMNPTLYTNRLYFTNGHLAFGQHGSGSNVMMNGCPWDFQGFDIVNARLVGSQMSYSLKATSPGVSVCADTASVETMMLQEDFSEYDEENNAVIVKFNEGFKAVYGNNKKLENENEQLKQENKKLKNMLVTTQEAMDFMLIQGVM